MTSLQNFWITKIAGTLGTVLLPIPGERESVLERASRPIVRVCIEWLHERVSPKHIDIKMEGEKIRLPVDVTHLQNSCFCCGRQGHIAIKCPGDTFLMTDKSASDLGREPPQMPLCEVRSPTEKHKQLFDSSNLKG